jgi:hypothetical protein
MSTLGIPHKTPEGVAEMAQRRLALSQRHRTLLLLVDGRRPLGEVLRLAQQAGVPGGHIDELVALGLVVVPMPAAAAAPVPPVVQAAAGVRVSVAQPVVPPAPPIAPARPRAQPPQAPDAPEDDDVLRASRIDIVLGSHFHHDGPGQAIEHLQPTPAPPSEEEGGPSPSEMAALDAADSGLAEARALLVQALKDEAPVVGALTLMRVRRARDRESLRALLPEVRQRLSRQRRVLDAGDVLRRAREWLDEGPLSR